MRIRFSTRIFLGLVALVLIGSYWGYRYYYVNVKYFGTFLVNPSPGNNHFIDHEIEFQSDSISFAELTLIEEPGKPAERRHPYSLLANTKYKIRLYREEFEFSELNSKPLSKPLWIFPGYVVEQLDWLCLQKAFDSLGNSEARNWSRSFTRGSMAAVRA